MRLNVLKHIDDVTERQLCCGCGACAAVDPGRIEMVDTLEHGRRPRVRHGARSAERGGAAMRVCPGVGLAHDYHAAHPGLIRSLAREWGPVLEVWEGHASHDGIRFAASSGGAATALALACMERGGMHGTLHVRARADAPILNETVLSTSRTDVLAAVGSRYAPASPCEGLPLVESAPSPCVFIGKPCDVAATRAAARIRPALRGRIGLTIAVFCAGTPTTQATVDLLKRVGVGDPRDVVGIRYRGHGWPGRAAVTVRTQRGIETRRLDYEQAWGGVLTRKKQWRCHVCADHTGEFADIAVGDPWHRPRGAGEPGRSLILVRTERGRRLLRLAEAHGYLVLERADPSAVARAQPELRRARGAVWGRLLACRLLGIPAPRYRRLPMFRTWLAALTLGEKARSIAGTIRRIRSRGLHRRVEIAPLEDAFRRRVRASADPGAAREDTPRRAA